MPRIRVSLTVAFQTPPSVGAGGAGATVADKVVTRNARGQFVIPASQVKGKLRHACEQLLRSQGVENLCQPPRPEQMCPSVRGFTPPCLLCSIFGSPHERSRLRFHDLVAAQPNLPEETLRQMVSLSRLRRTAEAGRLYLVETAPYVGGLEFSSDEAVGGYVSESAHAHLLLAGLKLMFSWGGGASRGLGWGEITTQAWLDEQPVGQFSVEEVRRLCQS